MHVVACHVNFCAKHHCPFIEFSRIHFFKQRQIFLYRAVTIRAVCSGRCRSAFLSCDLLAGLLVHICLSLLDKAHGEIIKLREIITGIIKTVLPVVTQPVYVFFDCLNIFRILFLRICVIKTKIAGTPEFLGRTEIHDKCLGMSDMQIAVGLRRETSIESSSILAGLKVCLDFLLYKIETALCYGFLFLYDFFHNAILIVNFPKYKIIKKLL